MAQKRLGKLYPKIEGDPSYGFKYISLIKTDTAFAASSGLSGTAVEGQVRYDESDDQLKLWNGSAEVSVVAASAAGTGLDGNYDINKAITIDAGAITMSGSATTDHLQIATSGNQAADTALLDLVWTGTPNAGANMIRLDPSGATTTGSPYLIEAVGTGEVCGFAYIDTDPTSVHQIYLHTDGIIGDGCSQLYIDNDGTMHAGGNLLALDGTGMTATNTPYAMSIDVSGVDIAALTIDTDAATDHGVLIHGGGAIANDKGLLTLTSDGTPANAGSNMLRVDGSGADNSAQNVLVEIYDDDVATGLSVITSPTGNDAVIIQGDGAMTNGMAALAVSGSGDIAAGGCIAELILDGSSPDTDARVLEIMAGAKDVRALYIDSASATNDGVYILNDGALAAGKAAVMIDINGDIDATAHGLMVEAKGATASNNAYLVRFDTSSKDAGALIIDSDAATDSAVHMNCGGALTDNQALLELTLDGTPANAGSNVLRLDVTGADTTIVPTVLEIDAHGATARGIFVDADCTSTPVVSLHGGGALTNGLGVLNLTNDGTLATGGNLLNVTMGAAPADETACAVEIVAAQDCQALAVATSAATASGIVFTGSGATANDTAVFEVNWGSSTPANAGANLVRIDGTDAIMTNKPVLCEILDDGISVGLSVSTASIEDMVSLIGIGNTGTDKAVLDVTWGAVTPAVTSNLVRIDASSATTSSKPILLEVYDSGVAAGAVINTASIEDVVQITGSGATGSDKAVLDLVWGAIAPNAGGNILRVDGTGATDTNAPYMVEVLGTGADISGISVDVDNATNHGVSITGTGVIANDKAALYVGNDAAIAVGASLVRIESAAASAGATAYGMTINCDGTNLEALWVEKGTVLIAETLEVTAGITSTAIITAPAGVQGILGTAADLTDVTPTSAEFDTAFGSGNKTKGGFTGVVEDSGSGVTYLVVSDGTTWHFALLTAAG